MDAVMRANEIHLTRAKLLLDSAQTILALVVLRAVITSPGDGKGMHEIIYSIQVLTDADSTQYLLIERLHDCEGNCLAAAAPDHTDDIPQRAWVFSTYNEAAYIMGVEWLLASHGGASA
jgi:hypothetical protein